MKRPELVKAVAAAIAPAFCTKVGRITEQGGRLGSMN
jgi:hypothetical protein